jgi:hypothetical protein
VLASPSAALAATSPVQHGSAGPGGFAVAVQPCGLTWRSAYEPGTVPRQVKVARAPPGSV